MVKDQLHQLSGIVPEGTLDCLLNIEETFALVSYSLHWDDVDNILLSDNNQTGKELSEHLTHLYRSHADHVLGVQGIAIKHDVEIPLLALSHICHGICLLGVTPLDELLEGINPTADEGNEYHLCSILEEIIPIKKDTLIRWIDQVSDLVISCLDNYVPLVTMAEQTRVLAEHRFKNCPLELSGAIYDYLLASHTFGYNLTSMFYAMRDELEEPCKEANTIITPHDPLIAILGKELLTLGLGSSTEDTVLDSELAELTNSLPIPANVVLLVTQYISKSLRYLHA